MRSFLRLPSSPSRPRVLAGVSLAARSQPEAEEGKMDGPMDKMERQDGRAHGQDGHGKMEGRWTRARWSRDKMDKGKMEAGKMDNGKMDKMDKGKMEAGVTVSSISLSR